MSELRDIAVTVTARYGLSLEQLQAHDKSPRMMVVRRAVATALLEAGATWRDCGRLLKRDETTIAEMVLRRGPRPTFTPMVSDHCHLCTCDGCLNGENPLISQVRV